MIKVSIGYDHVESAAYRTFCHSIERRSSMPVTISPVSLPHFKGLLTRPRDPKQSNEFSFSRFLVPYMHGYEGWAIFADCDMLCRDDIAKLWALRDDRYAVMCVHHNHEVDDGSKKYLGTIQYKYGRKNWTSVMLMNCRKLHMLTPEYVNTAHGLELHQFQFLSDDQIGWIPKQWNLLVGYDDYDPNASIVHFTEGGPYFEQYENCDYAQEWREEYLHMLHVEDRSKATLMYEHDIRKKVSEK